jgi:thiol-disulfide isomerase/thioredoxin
MLKSVNRLVLGGLVLLATALAINPGEVVPAFRLSDPGGKSFTLAELKGKPSVITFWATWCPICKTEMPKLHALAQELKLRFYVISPTDTDKLALDHMKQFPGFIPLVSLKGGDTPKMLADRWRVVGQPVTLVLDAEGKVVGYHPGRADMQALRDDLALVGIE